MLWTKRGKDHISIQLFYKTDVLKSGVFCGISFKEKSKKNTRFTDVLKNNPKKQKNGAENGLFHGKNRRKTPEN